MMADVKNPFDLYVGGHRVTTSPRAEFAKYAWPYSRFISFPSRGDGKPVAARLFLPQGYRLEDRSQKARPAVFFIHGSGYATSVLKQWGAYQELRYVFNCSLVNKGYVVLDLDYRGSSGYGRDWRTGVFLHMGGPDLDDVLGGVDYLRGLGNIDMKRMGMWGSSYGGFMTAMAMFLSPDTFRAGASFSAVNDWENYNAYYTEQRLGKPQENPEAYRRSSPIHFSSMLKNPFLMVHGIVDNNVMFQDTVQLSEKLIHEGKDFSEIYYPEESHIFVRDETLIDAFRRATEFFDRRPTAPAKSSSSSACAPTSPRTASSPKRAVVTRAPRNSAGLSTRWTAPPTSPTASPCSTSRSASKRPARSSPAWFTILSGRKCSPPNAAPVPTSITGGFACPAPNGSRIDRKSTRLNSSHLGISYAVFCLKK